MSKVKDDVTFVEWVKLVMEERGLDQATLAKRMDMSPASVSRVLNGDRQPGQEFLSNFAQATSYSRAEVFRRAGWLPSLADQQAARDDADTLSLYHTLGAEEQRTIKDIMRGLIARRNATENGEP